MKYRKFGQMEEKVSVLGFGCMRLPTVDGDPNSGAFDEDEAIRMLQHGIDSGINYIDTAYYYHSGQSESLVGKALLDGYREKVYLATKSPVFSFKSEADFDRILDDQLARLQTGHIDFYLLHALDRGSWENVVLKYDLLTKMEQAKAEGKIRHIGFSFHDEYEVFEQIVDGYDHWDFCQIQLNYIDITHQAGIKGLEYAAEKGLGVIVMEPLLGGKLAQPTDAVAAALSPDKTPVEWALDFVWNRPEVALLLSGMHDRQQVEENLLYAARSSAGMLSKEDLDMLTHAKQVYDTMALVSCTKCSYCMPCPFGLDIPKTFEAYNSTVSLGTKQAGALYEQLAVKADACRACGRCEKACPQHLPISMLMTEIQKTFQIEKE